MKSIRTVLVLTSVALIAALHGQEVVPAGTPINQITAIVNPNGEATNVPNGTQVNAQGTNCPPIPIYDQSVPSQYYFPTQSQIWDSYPLGGPALIDRVTFYTYQPPGPGATLSFAFFNYPNVPSDIYEIPCQPFGPLLCSGTLTIPSGLNSVTFVFTPPCSTQCADIAIATQLVPQPGGQLAGMLVAEGSAQGLVVGHPISLLRNVYPADANGLTRGYQSSPGDSVNGFFTTSSCLWFGGRPIGNFCLTLRGWFSFIGHLTGDYGVLGPLLDYPDEYIKVQITDSTNSFFSEEIVRVTPRTDPAGPGWFTIPFDCATFGQYIISVYPFKGYMGSCVVVNPIPFQMNCWDFSLISGDLTGDNNVDVFDLNIVFTNFGKSGCKPVAHGRKVPIIPKAIAAFVRCIP